MTQSSDRLDQIEALLAENARQLVETRKITESNAAGLRETRQLIDSNARAIEAWDSRITEGDQRTQTQLEASIADTVAMIADLGQQQAETDERFQIFLAEGRADRQRAEQRDQEWKQKFDEQIAEMRQGREANSTEHRAFTQNIQTLLAEIARLWQRVS